MFARNTTAARGRHRAAPRRTPMLRRATTVTVAAAVAVATVLVADSASAVSYNFVIDSLAASGADAAKGDGVCATATGTCTLRAAIEESNALSGTPGSVKITVAPGLSGTISPVMAPSTTNWMTTATITTLGDIGAFYEITAPVSIDLDNRVSILPASEPVEAAAIHVNGPDVELRNLTDVFGSGSSIVMGPKAARVTVDGGSSVTRANYFPERFVVYRQGATDITVRNYHLQGFYDDGALTGLFVFNATDPTVMRNIKIHNIDVTYPSGVTCTPTDGSGCSTNLTHFYPRGTNVVLDGFTFTGSRVQDMPNKYGFKFTDVQLSNLTISDNRFLNVRGNGTGNDYAFVALPHRWLAGTNVISGNQFVRATTGNTVAVFWDGVTGTGTTASNLSIKDNYFDGYSDASIRLTNSGLVSVEKNRFGPRTASQARPATGEETAHASVMLDNAAATANRQVATWYPSTDATVLSGPVPAGALRTQVPAGTTAPLCTASMDVTKPTAGTVPWGSTSTLDVYWTADNDAEIYLGRVTGVAGSPQRIYLDLPVGAQQLPGTSPSTPGTAQVVDPVTGAVNGFVRVQTLVPESGATASSQYSRTVALTGTCAPSLVLDQSLGQGDPTLNRDLHYQLSSSVPLDPSSVTTSDFTLNAAATAETIDAARLNPRIASVTAVPGAGDTAYDIVVRVDDAATTTLGLAAGKVTAVSGVANAAPASSKDDQITFVNPVTVGPARFSLVTGNPDGKDYTLAVKPGAPAPSAPLDFTASFDQAGADHGLTLSTTTPSIAAGGTTSGPVTVTAPAAPVDPDTLTTIAHTLTSTDTNYDGLVVAPVHPHLFATDPTISITKQAYVDVADATSAARIEATGTRALAGTRLTDGQAVCFLYTVTNTSSDGWATTLTDVKVTDSDKRLGTSGLIGTVARLEVGQSTQVFACTSLIDADTTAS